MRKGAFRGLLQGRDLGQAYFLLSETDASCVCAGGVLSVGTGPACQLVLCRSARRGGRLRPRVLAFLRLVLLGGGLIPCITFC